MVVELDLPYPPSLNHYFSYYQGRPVLSKEARAYRHLVRRMASAKGVKPLMGTLAVRIEVHPPDNRRRDADNVQKSVLEWQRDDGAAMRIGRCLIDANWGQSTDVVYQFCRQSRHAAVIMPSHGRFVGASSLPFSEYRRRPGDRVGLNWRIPNVHGKRAIRHVIYDTNWWKSFVNARLWVSMGDRGTLSIFGTNPETHRMLAEHLTSEYFVKTQARGRTVDEWKQRPEQPDNHWLDCLVGASVGASMLGCVLPGTDANVKLKTSRLSFRDLQHKKRS